MMFCGFLFIGLIAYCVEQMSASFNELTNTASDDPVTEKYVSGNRDAENKVVILTVEGIITGAEDSFIAKQIRQIIKDENVKAVVLRVDSPGGTMSGSDYYHYLLKKMKKERGDLPIVVSMGSIAASGGYYIAMVGDEIFAERSTITGSIGVVVPMFKAVELSKKIGIESTSITSGPLKGMGSMMQPMSDEEKAVWERLIDDNFQRFKEVIREGREEFAKDPASLDKLATGQIYTATEAEANHLIDRIGFLDDAISAGMNRAGLNETNAKAVKYRPKLKFMDILLETRSSDNVFGTKTLQDLTTPRLYLLCPHVLPIGK
jgi:protease-4